VESDSPLSACRACPQCGSSDVRVRFTESPHILVQCLRCALVYHGNPPANGLLYEQYYSSEEPDPAQYRSASTHPPLAELYAINEQRIASLQRWKSGGRLLDVGSGRGFFLMHARNAGYQVEGIEIADRAAEYARTNFHLTIRVSSLEQLPAGDGGYDIVTLWHVLEHFDDPYAALRMVRSILKKDGMCVAEVPNLHSLKFQLAASKWEGGNHPRYHRTFFTAETLRRAFENAGFSSCQRLRLSYRIPGRNFLYESAKAALNVVGRDAFLVMCARR
jgi:2-polyprenyl-3-methyl-5-hydroxy-6-metoxy-1,4-benzoquinol methylase